MEGQFPPVLMLKKALFAVRISISTREKLNNYFYLSAMKICFIGIHQESFESRNLLPPHHGCLDAAFVLHCRRFVLLWKKKIYYCGGASVRDRRIKEKKQKRFSCQVLPQLLRRRIYIFLCRSIYTKTQLRCLITQILDDGLL